ncbi:hypothetical protein C8J56DRAFT_897709 [Mycena floridula]|nr:hypothetical protein C8J56DRAFT_897709 [Mycena floridula]
MSKSQMKKSKASAKKQKEKQRQVATRASIRLNPSNAPDNPATSLSFPTTSEGQSLGSHPSYTFGSIPSNLQTHITPNRGPVQVPSSALSSLDTLTPSPVPIPDNGSPFMTPRSYTNATGQNVQDEYQPFTNIYTFIPGLGFLSRTEENPATITEADFPNVNQPNIANERTDEPGTSSAQMTERECAIRCAEKSKHHGAASIGHPRQPPVERSGTDHNAEEGSRSFLPTAASTELNTLFNQAITLITSSLGPSIDQPQTDAIANAAGNHFAANLESAVAKLMLPRRDNENDTEYAAKINAQFRFMNGNANEPVADARSHSESRSNVHFSPSTSGGSVNRPADNHRIDHHDQRIGDWMPEQAQGRRTNSIEMIEPPVVRANREFKDRVAIQRMRNVDMRQSGQSPYQDQNISFDESGNPFDCVNLPTQPVTAQTVVHRTTPPEG